MIHIYIYIYIYIVEEDAHAGLSTGMQTIGIIVTRPWWDGFPLCSVPNVQLWYAPRTVSSCHFLPPSNFLLCSCRWDAELQHKLLEHDIPLAVQRYQREWLPTFLEHRAAVSRAS